MKTRDKILTEALRLFAAEGFEAVSVERIAAAVGIKAPSLYKHFASKRDIFDSILRRMEQQDAESAAQSELPTQDTQTAQPSGSSVKIDDFIAFSERQFRFWTEDEFGANFRRLLTVEQYRSTEMNALFQQYFGMGPFQYTADLLGSQEAAVSFYAPMFFLYAAYDAAQDKQAVMNGLHKHFLKQKEEHHELSVESKI